MKVIRFLGLPVENLRINHAVKSSTFEILKGQEQEKGFNEKPVNADMFFRKGVENDWLNYLTKEQVKKIRLVNEEMMEKFGYLGNAF